MKKQTTMILKIATVTFLAASIGMVLFPIQRNPVVNEVNFVRNIEQLGQSHGAADQWNYLFEDDTQVYTGQLWTTTGSMTPTTPTTTTPTPTTSSLFATMQESFYQAIGTSTTGWIYQGTLTGTIQETWTIGKSCITPRGQTIADKDFVLAYEQREDVNTICNIERRICNDGILEWTYTQSSCKEDVIYEYQKVIPISYNQPVVNPLVQPGAPINAGAQFSTQGQLNGTKTPTNMRWPASTSTIVVSPTVSQTTVYKADCTAPRGGTIKHGQFVKAYKSSVGLIDVPCETQLRLCVNGTLKWTFLNKKCTFKEMTYEEYRED